MGAWLLGRRDDTRDALIEAALAEVPQAVAAWNRLLSLGLRPRQDGVTSRWLPLVAHNIGGAVTDSRSIEILKHATREGWAQATALLSAAAPPIAALRDAGIDAVLLKGAALAAVVYPHPGVRPFGDVDLLVRPRDCEHARSILTTLGWAQVSMRGGGDHEGTHAVCFTGGRADRVIDLHRFVMAYTDGPDVDAAMWTRIERTESHGVTVGVLSPADHLLHTCAHGPRWSGVHAATWVADATWIIRTAGDRLDWDVLVGEARARRLGYQAAEALQLVGRLGRVPIPSGVLARLGAQATFVERLECRASVRPWGGVAGWAAHGLSWRRAHRSRRSGTRGQGSFLAYFATKAGVRSSSDLLSWGARVADRWVRGWRTGQPPDGRSSGPTLGR